MRQDNFFVGKNFNVHKVRQFLRVTGTEYNFVEKAKNDFGEPTDTVEETKAVFGVFDTTGRYYETKSTSDGSVTRSKSTVSIFTLYEPYSEEYSGGKDIKPDMEIIIDGLKYKVIGVDNLGSLNIAVYITLEVYDGWNKT